MAKAKTVPAGGIQHVKYISLDSTGVLKEIAVVKEWDDGSMSYIETAPLDMIDRGRLKNVLKSPHADKYELWELLSMTRINNGMNGLDYFHQLTKMKSAPGARQRVMGGSLKDAPITSNKMIGEEFTNPREVNDQGDAGKIGN
jgi:hypothetical protein